MKHRAVGPAARGLSAFEAKVEREIRELIQRLQNGEPKNTDDLRRLAELFDVLTERLREAPRHDGRSALRVIARVAKGMAVGKLVKALLDRILGD